MCLCVFGALQRAHRNIFPLLRGAAVLLSPTRSRAGHCICVLCIASCVRLWIVSETMVCFALKGHLNHLPLGCKRRRICGAVALRQYVFPPTPVLSLESTVDVMNHNLDMSVCFFLEHLNTIQRSATGVPHQATGRQLSQPSHFC